jgi:GTP-binding protein
MVDSAPESAAVSLDTSKLKFITGAHTLGQCPADGGREVAFAGRSNVGKSSAINAITGRNALARISKTPGRTQQINFFALDEEGGLRLVDLPGYGYAKVARSLRQHWDRELESYLRRRQSLVGLVLIVDSRHPPKDFDRQMLRWCAAAAMPVHVLLTKADKLGRNQAASALAALRRELKQLCPGAGSQLFSATRGDGVDEAVAQIGEWLGDGSSEQKKAPDRGMG